MDVKILINLFIVNEYHTIAGFVFDSRCLTQGSLILDLIEYCWQTLKTYRENPAKMGYSGNMRNRYMPKNSAATKRIFASK